MLIVFCHSSAGCCIYLAVYDNNIIITGNDEADIHNLKQHLSQHFQAKDLGPPKYFLRIEVAQQRMSPNALGPFG